VKAWVPGMLLAAAAACSAVAAPRDLKTRAQIDEEVARLWSARAFDKLDAIEQEFRQGNPMSLSGYPLLDMFHQAVYAQTAAATGDQAAWDALEAQARAWAKQAPKSPTAQLAVAEVFISHAWKVRGNKPTPEVFPNQLKEFGELVDKARGHLMETRAVSAQDPCWYEWMLRIALWKSQPEADYKPLLDEALAKFPDYLSSYLAAVDHYAPKWGGSPQAVEAFAQHATASLPPAKRDTLYARLYNYAYQQHFTTRADSKVDCARWLHGNADLTAAYPAAYNLNLAALSAALCADRPAAKKYFDLIGNKPMEALWGGGQLGAAEFDRAREWAMQGR